MDTVVTPVKVKVFNLEWLFRDGKNFVTFVKILKNTDISSIFGTDFVKYLLAQFWTTYQLKIFLRMFCPFICYLVMSIAFIYFML